MKRRHAWGLGLWLLASLHVSLAQARVDYLKGTTPDANMLRNLIGPFRETLRELGHEEGRNLTLDFRWVEGKSERLLARAVEVIP